MARSGHLEHFVQDSLAGLHRAAAQCCKVSEIDMIDAGKAAEMTARQRV
jgi:hypothetical protein